MNHGKNQHQHSRQYCHRRVCSTDCYQDLLMEHKNIFDNMDEPNPAIEYVPLEDLLNFMGFNFENYRTDEVNVLQPQLEQLGYSDVTWQRGETDSFGPLTRVCRAKDGSGRVVWFVYG